MNVKINLSTLRKFIRQTIHESYDVTPMEDQSEGCDEGCQCDECMQEGEGTKRAGDGGYVGPTYLGSQVDETDTNEQDVLEKAPPGFKGTAKAMKKHKEINNPFALSWYMKNKGAKSHYAKTGKKKK